MDLVQVSRTLRRDVDRLRFSLPVTHVYNPLAYAQLPAEEYLRRYGSSPKRAVFLGMNPGPFGMVQTGVPFGDVTLVREFLEITGKVGAPASEHPKRPVRGFDCTRSEVSGTRLWGWVRERFETPQAFFAQFFVHNYCPLAFLEESGRNRTPDKLPAEERAPLFEACNQALRRTIAILEPEWVIGIGIFAERRAREVLADTSCQIGSVLHPSPASPKANRGWSTLVEAQLREYGLLDETRSSDARDQSSSQSEL